ncbi:MAG TPA: TIGR00303 family protein [Methanomassiliicoccales archaeon]|nr:TIGR00303 family protein [Methanomassiliicoccales archaeon]
MCAPKDIIICGNQSKAEEFVKKVQGKKPAFVCVIGNTETAKIPGISAAGANPEFTDYTPAADMELLHYGKCKVIDGVPVTPDGIPTPAIITMSALELAEMPIFVVNGGCRVLPFTPYFEVGGTPGGDIRTGKAVENPKEVFEESFLLGKNLAKTVDYLVVGESTPGGTTTALGVLLALGYDAEGKESSSFPQNPHDLKINVVREGLTAAKADGKQIRGVLDAVAVVGDPMMPAAAGLVAGAALSVPVIMAGGTQMAAVLAVIKGMKPEVLKNIALGTTRWIIEDKQSDMISLVAQSAEVPILAVNLDFSESKYDGLRIYETGLVKEGAGAGGVSVAAILGSNGTITCRSLLEKIDENYARILDLEK